METWNADYIDSQYALWKKDPSLVSTDWQYFFKGAELAGEPARESPDADKGACTEDQALRQGRVEHLTYRYRDLGHLLACLDPLASCPTEHPLLALSTVGLTPDDLSASFHTDLFPGRPRSPLKEILRVLRETYCRSIGVEYMHIQDPEERKWLQERMESTRNRPQLTNDARLRIHDKLCQSHLFESFLNRKYPGQTRFSLEGAEVLIPMLDALTDRLSAMAADEVILGMPHRGRLNVQTNILMKSYEEVFCEFESTYDPDSIVGAGDVKYHKGYVADIETRNGRTLRVALMSNPSHLESVNPVVEGFARARQTRTEDRRRNRVVPLLLHGDAAFAGQGIVAEVLNMSQLAGYRTGGTIHLVVNNQIGYTTLPENARSTRYATDAAKMLMVPVFHVHGENPEAAVHTIHMACDYRMRFNKDVVIDLVCFRRYGHNEGDEPYFTQPLMYDRIKSRPALKTLHRKTLIDDGVLTEKAAEKIDAGIAECLEQAHSAAKKTACALPADHFYEGWEQISGDYSFAPVNTTVSQEIISTVAEKLLALPEKFTLHRTLQRLYDRRRAMRTGKEGVDWAFAEALAFATLVMEKIPVRLSGQDSRRGTFSQRHAVVTDQETGAQWEAINHLADGQARFTCYNSLLSESGVLGFEYGYSLSHPGALVLWEAQFGDFANGAQTIIDLYIAAGQSKWQRLSGLVMLLPHGYEGMGPEHSSARLERFLQLAAEENIQILQPTTPVQYFHMLRRQARAGYRKPMVVMTPKSLMRLPAAVSDIADFSKGGFAPVLADPAPPPRPKTVILCSGKLYYELAARRLRIKGDGPAIVRLEQLYPFPESQLKKCLSPFTTAKTWLWAQEEPENMGAWRFVKPHIEAVVKAPLAYIGREAAASPATGLPGVYRQQQAAILDRAVGREKATRPNRHKAPEAR